MANEPEANYFFAQGIGVGRMLDENEGETAYFVMEVLGQFGGATETMVFNIAVPADSWPTFVEMMGRVSEVGEQPAPPSEPVTPNLTVITNKLDHPSRPQGEEQ